MILTAGSPDALSFTDDTSLPNADAKVSIHAQVIRELPLDWYYALLQRMPSHAGELKSTVIVEVFFTLPDFERRTVLSTLKTVRIHATDPRPYTHDIDDLLADIVPGGDVTGFIKRLDRARQQVAENERRKLIARRMLHDAPPQQIRMKHLLWEYQAGLRISISHGEPLVDEELMPYFEEKPPKEFDFTPFARRRKNVVNVLSAFLSKSESVFCEALDGIDEFIERGTQSPMLVAFQLSRILSESHAFDMGDTQGVQWIDGERHDVLRRIDRRGMFQCNLPRSQSLIQGVLSSSKPPILRPVSPAKSGHGIAFPISSIRSITSPTMGGGFPKAKPLLLRQISLSGATRS
jgi:hypothetical protein